MSPRLSAFAGLLLLAACGGGHSKGSASNPASPPSGSSFASPASASRALDEACQAYFRVQAPFTRALGTGRIGTVRDALDTYAKAVFQLANSVPRDAVAVNGHLQTGYDFLVQEHERLVKAVAALSAQNPDSRKPSHASGKALSAAIGYSNDHFEGSLC